MKSNRKAIMVTPSTHQKLRILANKLSQRRGRFTSVRAIVGALTSEVDIDALARAVEARQGLYKLGQLKRMAARMAEMERQLRGIVGTGAGE